MRRTVLPSARYKDIAFGAGRRQDLRPTGAAKLLGWLAWEVGADCQSARLESALEQRRLPTAAQDSILPYFTYLKTLTASKSSGRPMSRHWPAMGNMRRSFPRSISCAMALVNSYWPPGDFGTRSGSSKRGGRTTSIPARLQWVVDAP